MMRLSEVFHVNQAFLCSIRALLVLHGLTLLCGGTFFAKSS